MIKNLKFKISGHEEYHVAHSFFFQSGSVYLLLFDCSKKDIIGENKLLYWFHFLQTQIGSKSPVILVATKIDLIKKSNSKKEDKVLKINNGNDLFSFLFLF